MKRYLLLGAGLVVACSSESRDFQETDQDSGTAGSVGSVGSGGDASGDAGGGGGGGGGDAGGGAGGAGGACAIGAEGCPCTDAFTCDAGLICRGTTCAAPACGDMRVEGSEVCDDGNNLGSAVGDCAPDCSKLVDQKRIVQSSAGVRADFARSGSGSLLTTADSYCPGGYKALFADGIRRIATVTPNQGDGQMNWVLHPWTRYVNADGRPIALTNRSALLGASGGSFSGLTNPIVPGSNSGYITGMAGDWTALGSGRSCDGWASVLSSAQVMIGIGGETGTRFLEQAPDFTYPCNDVTNWRVYCVEQ